MKNFFTILCVLLLASNVKISADIIDLRGNSNAAILADTILDVASGSLILLDNTMTYTLGGQAINSSLTITGDESAGGMPTINFGTSALNVATGATIDSIVFKKVKLTGVFANAYVMNTDKDVTFGKLAFEGCTIRVLRGILRMKGTSTGSTSTITATLDKFSINNCIIDSINGYGVANVDYTGCQINNFSITNSTINKAQKVIVSKVAATSVKVTDCTVFDAPQGTRYFIDFSNSSDITNPIEITNCIFGPGWSNGSTTDVLGLRIGTSSSSVVTNSYSTSDYSAPVTPIPSLIAYTGTSGDLFTDTTTLNFLIKDPAFEGKFSAGDPRWYYVTSVVEANNNSIGIKLYKDELRFASPVSKATIYNINGKVIKSAQNLNYLSISNLSRGIYVVKVTDSNSRTTILKFIK